MFADSDYDPQLLYPRPCWEVSDSIKDNRLLYFSIEEGAAPKPPFEGGDRSPTEQTTCKPTVEEDRRGRMMTRMGGGDGGEDGKGRSEPEVEKAQRGKQDASLELSKQHGGIGSGLHDRVGGGVPGKASHA